MWSLHKENPLETGKRYYSKVCTAKYMQKWGVLCEIGRPDLTLYALADMPPQSLQDAKAMSVQRRFGHAKTPQELLSLLPSAHPLDRGAFLRPVPAQAGVFRFDVPMFRSLDKFDWYQLYNLVDISPEAVRIAASTAPPSSTAASFVDVAPLLARDLPPEAV